MRHVRLRLPSASLEMQAPDHLYIPRVLQKNGLANYEPETLAAVLTLVEARPGVFVDVGANVGVFSLLVASELQRPCVAFEPLPDAAAVLSETVAHHRLPVEVSRLALADRDSESTFYVSAQTDSSSGLNRRFRKAKTSFKVATARADSELSGRKVSLLKLDTETTEPAVLSGATRLIDQERPPLIIEVLKGRTESSIAAFFEDRSYSWYQITNEVPWTPSGVIAGDPSYQYNNWLFTPEPLQDGFWSSFDRWRARLRTCVPTQTKSR